MWNLGSLEDFLEYICVRPHSDVELESVKFNMHTTLSKQGSKQISKR